MDVASAWQAHRRRVLDIGYRMLGTLSDAEDAAQETYLRLVRTGVDGIDDVEGWLVTVAGRVCLDKLRADTTRARYVGPWLPEPLVDLPGAEPDPADRVTLDDSVRIALLTVLEQLTPTERLSFVLHDVFGLTFEQVAPIVGRSPGAVRKAASRARATIRDDAEPRFDVPPQHARAVSDAFASACATGDLAALVALLAPDVVGEFDSGGRITGAPLGPLIGAELVGATLIRTLSGAGAIFATMPVNGQPGVVVSLHDRVMAVIAVETDGVRVHAIRAIGNPEKLARLNPAPT
jgi:RNA polymerase sigma-70 factor, ECF subfamily